MATRKEERERRRAERLEAERRAASDARRRLILGYVAAGILTAAVVVGIVVALTSGGDGGSESESGEELPAAAHIATFSGSVNDYAPDAREGTPPAPVAQADLETAAEEAGCELRLDLPDEGANHIRDPEDAPEYETNPPTSGDHIDVNRQQADGAYSEPVDPVYSVHSLEHGRIVIQYSPDLSEAEQLELKGIFDEDPAGMLLYPNPQMPYEVAATAWTQMIGCKSYRGATALDAIRAFRDIYRGQGPEPVALSL